MTNNPRNPMSVLGFKQLKKVESIVDQQTSGRKTNNNLDEYHELRPLTVTVANDPSTGRGGSDDPHSPTYHQSTHVISRSFKMHTGCGGNKNIGWRLRQRRQINHKLRRVSDYALAFAIFGTIVMIIETELTMAEIYPKSSPYSYIMKTIISTSTLVLVGLILVYHSLMIQLFSVNNCIEDWRIAINARGIIQMLTEVIICSVHPIPVNISFEWTLNLMMEERTSTKTVSLDLILSLPMFLRLYLIFRTLLLHSRMFTDASSRSIGALNRVKFNIRFVMKTLMTICPGTVLIVFIISLWVTLSWIMRACESIHNPQQNNILNSMWVIAITFLSVGYGDLVPHTYCGRGIAVLTGVMGSSCTALVVAVFARKLELQRAEKHVHNFMMDNKSYKELRNSAANVLRETWLFYKYTKLVKQVNPGKIRSHQRKFLHAIKGLRKAKEDQRKLQEDSFTLVDLSKTQMGISEMVTNIREDQNCINQRITNIEENIKLVQCQLDNIPRLIQSAVNPKNTVSKVT